MKNLLMRAVRGVVLSAFDTRASVTTGANLSNPPSWLEKLLIGGSADDLENPSGVEITPANCLSISAVYACILAISEDVAKLPVWVCRDLPDGGKERYPRHVVARIFNVEPNEEMTPISFRGTLTQHALTHGNGMAEIVRLGNGRPDALYPMLPDCTVVFRDRSKKICYRYTAPGKAPVVLSSEQVFHIPGFGYDGLIGYSPITLARRSLGLTAAAEGYGASFFGNSSMPKGILEHPGKLGKTAGKNLRESWEENYRGSGNANKVGILEEGMKFNPVSIPPEDAQFLQTRQFQVTDICRWFRMPPHKIGDLSRATFSNIEHQGLDYLQSAILPWLVRWEQESRRKLFMSTESDYYVAHNSNSILRGDIESRYKAYSIGRQWGWLSANDVLSKEDENPIEDGDLYLTPINMADAGNLPDPNAAAKKPLGQVGGDPPDPDKPTASRMRDAFLERVTRERGRTADQIQRNAKRIDANKWAETFAGSCAKRFTENILPLVRGVVGIELEDMAGSTKESLEAESRGIAENLSAIHAARIVAVFKPGWIEDVARRTHDYGQDYNSETDSIIDFINTRVARVKSEGFK